MNGMTSKEFDAFVQAWHSSPERGIRVMHIFSGGGVATKQSEGADALLGCGPYILDCIAKLRPRSGKH